jgi:hypothetical protein
LRSAATGFTELANGWRDGGAPSASAMAAVLARDDCSDAPAVRRLLHAAAQDPGSLPIDMREAITSKFMQ